MATDAHKSLASDLVTKMFEKKPAGTKLTAAVCITVLQKKFADKFAGCDWTALTTVVDGVIANLEAAAAKAAATAAKKKAAASPSSSDSDDSEDSDDSDDSDEEGEEEEGDDEEGSDDSDDFEEDDSSDEEGEAGEQSGDDEQSGAKGVLEETEEERAEKAKLAAIAERAAQEGGTAGDAADDEADKQRARKEPPVNQRALGMVKCLKKVGIKYRAIGDKEDFDAYYRDYLVPLFKANDMDPARYEKADIAAYRMRRETKELLKDLSEQGVDAKLSRASRRTRGYASGEAEAAPIVKPFFIDE